MRTCSLFKKSFRDAIDELIGSYDGKMLMVQYHVMTIQLVIIVDIKASSKSQGFCDFGCIMYLSTYLPMYDHS